MPPKNKPNAVPKLHGTKLPPHPSPADPEHGEERGPLSDRLLIPPDKEDEKQ